VTPAGRVCGDGDRWLLADRADAASWRGTNGDCELILGLGTLDRRAVVGGGDALVLSSDLAAGKLDVFRVSPDQLLFLGYADEDDYRTFVRDALDAEVEPVAALDPALGEPVALGATTAWSDGAVVTETLDEAVPVGWGEPDSSILAPTVVPGTYRLAERDLDRDTYGLSIGRLSRSHEGA
jgi:hypothetical protein